MLVSEPETFFDTCYRIFIDGNVPVSIAYLAAAILDKQNRGELPCPLEENDREIVQSAHYWFTLNLQNLKSKDAA